MPPLRPLNANHMLWLLPLLSGILLALSAAQFDIGFFAWIGLVPLFFFLNHPNVTGKRAFWGGVITGTLYGFVVLFPLLSLNAWWWVSPSSFFWYQREALLLAVVSLTAVVTGGGTIGIFSYSYWKLQSGGAADIVAFSFVWMLLERAREMFVAGFTWGHLGYNVHEYTYALQSAKLFGVYTVSGIVVAVNMLVYCVLSRPTIQNRFVWYFVAFIIFVTGAGVLTVHGVIHDAEQGARVAVIHSPFSTVESMSRDTYNAHLALLKEALETIPDIVVLPENVFPSFVIDQQSGQPKKYEFPTAPIRGMYDELTHLSQTSPKTAVLFGAHTAVDEKRFNSLAVMQDGKITAVYDKRVLLPLAEDVPETLRERHIEPLERGSGERPVVSQDIGISPLICSEIIYPRAASRLQNGIIVSISNDGVFENRRVAWQHHIMAKMRAAENSMYLLRSTKNGISSVIDPFGRVISSTAGEHGQVLTAAIHY